MSATASIQAEIRAPTSHVKRTPRQGKHRVSPLTQVLDLKDIAYRDGTADSTPVHIRASLMRAFVDLQEIAMAIRGVGKPKPVDARNAVRKSKAVSAAPITSTSTPSASVVDKQST